MDKDHKIKYLANVISIARADGKITPREEMAIEEIRKKLGIKKAELKKAMKLAESSEYTITPIGCFADKVMNFHDMLYVSAIDKQLDESEKREILNFARSIGLTGNQINTILDDVKRLLSTTQNLCPRCKKPIDSNVKFCPECGCDIKFVEHESAVQVAYEIPTEGVAIEFAESTSASFPHIFEKATKAYIFKECVKGSKKWFLAAWPLRRFEESIPLACELSNLRNKRVFIDGKELSWAEVFHFIWCYQERNASYSPIEYCFGLDGNRFNIWGCRNSGLDWNPWAQWFSYGRFEQTGILNKKVFFVFDKKRIEHELKKNLFNYKFCPYLNPALISAVLKVFPDKVEISEKSDWEYKEAYERVPNSIKITQIKIEDGYELTHEFFACGAIPKGAYVGLNILAEAIKLCAEEEKYTLILNRRK